MRHILKDILYPLAFIIVAVAVCLPLCRVYRQQSADHPKSEILAEGEYIISPYDNIFRRVGAEHKIDWRLMSAIAYHESKFNTEAVSNRGALGIMQIMPHVAREYDIADEQLCDPVTNIELAGRLLHDAKRMIRLPRSTAESDRLAMMLACYNCGYAHLSDARCLTEYYGDDSSRWDVVSTYLELLSDKDFYMHEAVAYGRFTGSAYTIAYVANVLKQYDHYRTIAE